MTFCQAVLLDITHGNGLLFLLDNCCFSRTKMLRDLALAYWDHLSVRTMITRIQGLPGFPVSNDMPIHRHPGNPFNPINSGSDKKSPPARRPESMGVSNVPHHTIYHNPCMRAYTTILTLCFMDVSGIMPTGWDHWLNSEFEVIPTSLPRFQMPVIP